MAATMFLLSPANCSGKRASYLVRDGASFALAAQLRDGGATIAEIYTFMSGLYFRGKVAYGATFGSSYVIVPGLGLVPPDTRLTLEEVQAIAAVPVDPADPRYANPLRRDAGLLKARLGCTANVVLLGSIATPKYVEPLSAVFGSRLMVPQEFVGRGDMSRGALMLRCAATGTELNYVAALSLAAPAVSLPSARGTRSASRARRATSPAAPASRSSASCASGATPR